MIQVFGYVCALTETCKCPTGSCRFEVNYKHLSNAPIQSLPLPFGYTIWKLLCQLLVVCETEP